MRMPVFLALAAATALPLAVGAADGEPRFLDRELLVETLTLDDQASLVDAEEALATAEAERDAAAMQVEMAMTAVGDAQTALMEAEEALAMEPDNADLQAAVQMAMQDLMDAETDLGLAEDDLAAKELAVGERMAAVQAILDEIALTGELVGQLSDRQVQALNAALHSASKTGLLPFDIDTAWLQRIIDDELGTGPIHQLVTAYAQEARFERLAARFDQKAIDTGNEGFTERATRAREKGAAEFEKFVEKVDAASARAAAQEALQEERRAAIRGKALGHSK